MKNFIKAPQKSLQSSWRSECFSAPKTKGTIIKRSLGNRPNAIGKLNGSLVASSGFGSSNEY